MVRVNLRGINTVRKRLSDGSDKLYYYHRASGRPLKGKPGDLSFCSDYALAEREMFQYHGGTLNSLIHQWSCSKEWSDYAESTRKDYKRMLKNIEDRFGSMPIAAIEDPRVRQEFLKWRVKVASTSGPREADNRLSVVSALLTWCVDNGELTANHVKGFTRLYHSNRSDKIWLPENIDAFMRVAAIEMQRAMIIALHTGQRQGDILRLGWGNYDGSRITLRQGKSGFARQVEIPCTPALKQMLDGMPRISAVVLTTKTGRPWKARYFKRQWEECATKAEIAGLHFHDVRGATVTMLAEAGCAVPEIATITGHSLQTVAAILEKYLSRTKQLASSAILKFQNAPETKFANRLQTGTQSSKKGIAK